MKSFTLVLLFQFVIPIVVSHPVKRIVDIDDTDITDYGAHRYPRSSKPNHPPCNVKQYFDEEEGRCLGVIGGGRVLYINNTNSCAANVLKPHCTNPRYYYICKENKTILAQCSNSRHFEERLQKCVLVPDNEYSPVRSNLGTSGSEQVPGCKRPGSFPVPGNCALFYTCATDGTRMYQNFYRCPTGMAYDEETEMCSPSSTCEESKLSSNCLPSGIKETLTLEEAEKLVGPSKPFTVKENGSLVSCEVTSSDEKEVSTTMSTIISEILSDDGIPAVTGTDETTIINDEEITTTTFDELMVTTTSYVESLLPQFTKSHHNDDVNSAERVTEMSRSLGIDDSAATTTYLTTVENNTFEKETNLPGNGHDPLSEAITPKGVSEEQPGTIIMEEVTAQTGVESDTTDEPLVILADLRTTSNIETEVQPTTQINTDGSSAEVTITEEPILKAEDGSSDTPEIIEQTTIKDDIAEVTITEEPILKAEDGSNDTPEIIEQTTIKYDISEVTVTEEPILKTEDGSSDTPEIIEQTTIKDDISEVTVTEEPILKAKDGSNNTPEIIKQTTIKDDIADVTPAILIVESTTVDTEMKIETATGITTSATPFEVATVKASNDLGDLITTPAVEVITETGIDSIPTLRSANLVVSSNTEKEVQAFPIESSSEPLFEVTTPEESNLEKELFSTTPVDEVTEHSIIEAEITDIPPPSSANLLKSDSPEKEVQAITIGSSSEPSFEITTKNIVEDLINDPETITETGPDNSLVESTTLMESVLDDQSTIITPSNVISNTKEKPDHSGEGISEDGPFDFISPILPTTRSSNDDLVDSSTKSLDDAFRILNDKPNNLHGQTTTDSINLVNFNREPILQTNKVTTEINIEEASTGTLNVDVTKIPVFTENKYSTNTPLLLDHSKTDSYDFASSSNADPASYFNTVTTASVTELVNGFNKASVANEQTVENHIPSLNSLSFTEPTLIIKDDASSSTIPSATNILNKEPVHNTRPALNVVPTTGSTFVVNDASKLTTLPVPLVPGIDEIAVDENNKNNTLPVAQSNIMKITTKINTVSTTPTNKLNRVFDATEGFTGIPVETSSANTDVNSDGNDANKVSAIDFINAPPFNIVNNAGDVSEKSTDTFINTVNSNVDIITKGSSTTPFIDILKNSPGKSISESSELSTTIRGTTRSLEELLAECRARVLAESTTKVTESDSSKKRKHLKLLHKHSHFRNTAKNVASKLNKNVAEEESTVTPQEIDTERTISKNVALPIVSAVLNIIDKFERRIRDILKNTLY